MFIIPDDLVEPSLKFITFIDRVNLLFEVLHHIHEHAHDIREEKYTYKLEKYDCDHFNVSLGYFIPVTNC